MLLILTITTRFMGDDKETDYVIVRFHLGLKLENAKVCQ